MSEGYTVKEIVTELRSENRQALEVQSTILAELKSMNLQLSGVVERVDDNQKRINTVETFVTKAQMIWSGAVLVVGYVANQLI